MATEIRDCTQADLDYCRANPMNDANKGWDYPLRGWAKTLVIDGEVVGCGGCTYIESRIGSDCIYSGKPTGIGECWLQLSKSAEKHKVECVRCLMRLRDQIFDELKIWRLEATSGEHFMQTQAMIALVGFKKERLMINYSPDGGNQWLSAIEREVRIEE